MDNNSEYLAIFVRFLGDRALPFCFAGPIEIARGAGVSAYRICQRKGRSIFGRENIKKSRCGVYAETVKIASQNSTSIICRQLHTKIYINKIELKTHRTRSSLNHVSSKFEEVIFLIVVQPKK